MNDTNPVCGAGAGSPDDQLSELLRVFRTLDGYGQFMVVRFFRETRRATTAAGRSRAVNKLKRDMTAHFLARPTAQGASE